ncbi:MAG: hypothetical protein II117_06035 [Clostridia bacterium]|nr:hypothetical protein [Clostridia bacterium]
MTKTSEQLLSFAENELMQKESIRRAVLSEAPAKQKKPVAWTRILLPIAACFVLLCGTVLLIPSARAEVFRWLHIARPEQYLTEDPESRTPNEALDSLILPPVTDAPVAKQVTYVADEPIWQRIADDFRIDLGETMYDGEQLYLTVTLHGLTALPEVDAYTGGSATQTRVPEDRIGEFFEDGKVPEEFTNGTMSFFEESMGQYFLRFADGTEFCCGTVTTLNSNPDYTAALDRCNDMYGEDPLSDADREAISRDSIQWLSGSTLSGVVSAYTGDSIPIVRDGVYSAVTIDAFLREQADENGILTAQVVYRTMSSIPEETVHLEAELGTARFALGAVDKLDRNALTPVSQPFTFGHRDVKLSYTEWVKTDYDDSTHCVTNLPADLYGLCARIESAGTIDALGIHGVCLRFDLPGDWTPEMCAAFRNSLAFELRIDGKHCSTADSCDRVGTHTLLFTIDTYEFPYDQLASAESICITPMLFSCDTFIVGDTKTEMQDNVPYIHPDTNERVNWDGHLLPLPEAVFTLSIHP